MKLKMEVTSTKYLTDTQFQQIDRLWNEEYPLKLKGRFKILLDGVEKFNHYLIEDENQNILAWAVEFEKDNETRFSIIVNSKHQGKGLGKTLVKLLKEDLGGFYGWVIDHDDDVKDGGDNYKSPLAFYAKLGFEILHDQRIDADLLEAVKIKWCG